MKWAKDWVLTDTVRNFIKNKTNPFFPNVWIRRKAMQIMFFHSLELYSNLLSSEPYLSFGFCRPAFTWRSWIVQDKQWTHEQLQTKKTAVNHPGNNTVLRIKRMQTFEQGHFYKFNHNFLLWAMLMYFMWNILFRKNNMHFVWSHLFGKLINILQILQSVCTFLTTTVLFILSGWSVAFEGA